MTSYGDSGENERQQREKLLHKIAGAGRAYQWKELLAYLKGNPTLVNETRPGGSSGFAPIHQAAHGNAPTAIIQELLALGADLSLKTAAGELPVDVAARKGNDAVAGLLEPPAQAAKRRKIVEDENVDEMLDACALRFDGYKYEDAVKHGKPAEWNLSHLTTPIIESLMLHPALNDNFAAFFILQRHLRKWGGEYLTKYDKKHIAFDFLFLSLYRCDPPPQFQNECRCKRWEEEYLPNAEVLAAVVRKGFRRVGNGKSVQI